MGKQLVKTKIKKNPIQQPKKKRLIHQNNVFFTVLKSFFFFSDTVNFCRIMLTFGIIL